MPTQLSLYNGALRRIKERKLANLTENREPRRVLDDVYTDAVAFCLEEGQWKFAVRTAKFTREVSFVAPFGYKNQFVKPDDLVRVTAICQDEYFNTPLNQFSDEAGTWYSDLEEIYVSYVSNDGAYGTNLDRWPVSFTAYVETYLGWLIQGRLTGKEDTISDKELKKAKDNANSNDGMSGPTKFPPQGRWISARAYGSSRSDRGNRGQLIG